MDANIRQISRTVCVVGCRPPSATGYPGRVTSMDSSNSLADESPLSISPSRADRASSSLDLAALAAASPPRAATPVASRSVLAESRSTPRACPGMTPSNAPVPWSRPPRSTLPALSPSRPRRRRWWVIRASLSSRMGMSIIGFASLEGQGKDRLSPPGQPPATLSRDVCARPSPPSTGED